MAVEQLNDDALIDRALGEQPHLVPSSRLRANVMREVRGLPPARRGGPRPWILIAASLASAAVALATLGPVTADELSLPALSTLLPLAVLVLGVPQLLAWLDG
jgi:hypothetical protein